jgi:CheY-like chemotaxis protein
MSAAASFPHLSRRLAPLVLVADDDEDILAMVTMRLQRCGFDVVSARDGAEALALIRQSRPDIAVLDVSMPGVTGIEVTEAVRDDPELAGIRVVLLTASASDAAVTRGLAAGADAYVTKPFSPQDLATCVEGLLV